AGQITTIHAACYRMLREYYSELRSLSVAEAWRSRSIIEKYVERIDWTYFNPRSQKREPVGYTSILYWINEAKGAFVPWSRGSLYTFYIDKVGDKWASNLTNVALEYKEQMNRSNRWDFADMLYEAEKSFTYDKDFQSYWHERFSHLLIDEAQDTSAQAMRIVERLAPQSVFVVGDGDQAIYKFNGAAPELNLRDGFDRIFGGQRFNMTVNFRSHPTLLRRASSLIVHNYDEDTQQYAKTIDASEESVPGPDMTWNWYDTPEEEAAEIVAEIENEISSNTSQPGDYFIMGRINAQLAYFELELLRHNIPFVNLGRTSFFNRRVPKIITEYMRLAVDPKAWNSYDYVYNIASRYMTKRDGKYSQTRWLGREFNDRLDRNGTVLDELGRHRWDKNARGWSQWEKGAGDLIDLLMELQKYEPKHSALSFIHVLREEVLDAWIEAEYTTDEDTSSGEIDSVWDDLAVIEAIAQNLTLADFFTYLDQLQAGQDVKPEDLVDYVLIGTIYRFKGLERPNVYVVGVCEDILPHKFSMGTTPPTDGIPIQSKTTVWDERNVMYVAVTRAKRKCRVSGMAQWPGRKDPLVPSRFVYEMDLEEG
ncbi:MAG TPA: ATP-dependent helicase, partial [Bellilinea sp.]|nr:ATP-dependent helicase [Bellilinea sp.]